MRDPYWTEARKAAFIVAILEQRVDLWIVGPNRQVSGLTWRDDSEYHRRMAAAERTRRERQVA